MLFFDEEKKEKERRNSVRKYQARLGYYLRVLEKKFQELNIKEVNIHDIGLQRSITDVYKCVCLGLEETLMYIEECYGQYMDRSLTISYLKRKNFTEKYYQKCQQLITLFKNQELPAVIETEVCKPLYAIIEDRLHTMTYIRMEYYKKYIDLFTRLLTKNPSVHHDQIYKLLMALEYNTHNVYKALEEEALLRLDQIDSVRNKQLYTFQQLSKIQNVAITSSYKYYPEFPSLKTHFIEFIRKQIDLLQLQVDLEAAAQETTSSKKTDIVHIKNKTINKRKINMTVQEMALFARLFTEIGIISVNDSKQDYFKFLANAYQSKDADELSAKSIKNAFI